MQKAATKNPVRLSGLLLLMGASLTLMPGCQDGQEPPPQTREVIQASAVAFDAFERGEAVFNSVCVACHTVGPPPNLAPPIMAVSGHYREAFDNREEGIRAIAAWIADPDPARSRLGPMAIERFGPMAPLPLPDSVRQAVATWVWDVYDPEADPHAGGMGRGMMRGRGGPGGGGPPHGPGVGG